jgi:hypothetical protein
MKQSKKLTTTIPPLRGPNPQGLNISYNTVRNSEIGENNKWQK